MKVPTLSKELKSILGPIQKIAKFIHTHSGKTDRTRQLIGKKTERKWIGSDEEDFD